VFVPNEVSMPHSATTIQRSTPYCVSIASSVRDHRAALRRRVSMRAATRCR
jgi:hypothetical protein